MKKDLIYTLCLISVFAFWAFDSITSRSISAKQIEQRDSVNAHNAKVIESLHETIRLDSLSLIKQLYPEK
jgi:hypothetical protein